MMKVIAIDGPAGAGKSTVARLLAKKLNFRYMSTGLLYRAITWKALKMNANFKSKKELTNIAKNTKLKIIPSWKNPKVYVDGINVTDHLNTETISHYTNIIAKIPEIRKKLRKIQREIGKMERIVMEGRDIGTVVLPKAHFKFYIDASVEERAKRRYLELLNKNEKVSFNSILSAIIKRDTTDKLRKVCPLKQAKDAIHIDTTNLSPDETAGIIYTFIKNEHRLKTKHR